jgi:rare lipoprotein A
MPLRAPIASAPLGQAMTRLPNTWADANSPERTVAPLDGGQSEEAINAPFVAPKDQFSGDDDTASSCTETRFATSRPSAYTPWQRIQQLIMLAPSGIDGVASMYNPYRESADADALRTASGERYDPAGWTAAIQTNLRAAFGGVRYGKNYRPAYALIEAGTKKLIVRINDVGPLRPGRVIDLSERSMRYFDPTLEEGLVRNITITPLPGGSWTAGPVEAEPSTMSIVDVQ